MPKHGPNDGSLNAATAFTPILFSPSVSPILMVVFPSPAGVGLIAVTKTSLPSGLSENFFITSSEIFALYFPYSSNSSSSIPTFAATSVIFCNFAS